MTRMRWDIVTGAALAVVLLTTGSTAVRGQQRPIFRASAELVEVDVVVRDAYGNPIRGLTAADFVVLDRGQPQAIETFEAIAPDPVPDPDALPPMPMEIHVDISSNTTERADRLVVIVLDDLHTYQGRSDTVQDIARNVVSELGPGSSMALIHTSGDNNVEVTENRAKLLAAISRFKGRRAVRRPIEACDPSLIMTDPEVRAPAQVGCDQQEFDANQRLYKSLEDAARMLGGSDRRRKAFVLVSENVAKDLSGIFQSSIARDTSMPDGMAYASGGGADAVAAAGAAPTAYHDNALLDMMEAMRRGNVSTYSIDPRGEVSPQDLALECFGPGAGGDYDPCLGGAGLPDWYSWVRQAQHGLEIMSQSSGGFAVVNTDDFTTGVEDIMTDLDNYYLLGFYTSDLDSKGYRRLEVQVRDHPELTLRYRRGYRLDGAEEPDEKSSPLARLAGGALPTNDIPMRLFAAAMPYSNKEARVAVAMEISVPRLALQSENERLLDDIEYGLYVIDLKGGKVKEQVGKGAKIVLRPLRAQEELPDEVTYEITSVLQLPPGEYQLRASATSEKLDLGGSVYLPYTVPDYSKYAMGITDLVLAYADGPHIPVANSEGRSRIPAANVLPFEPSLDRVFRSSDTLRLFFQVLQKEPEPAVATIQVLDADGGLLLGMDLPVDADERVKVEQILPLQRLGPGLYRLRVAVTGEAGFNEKMLAFVIR